MTVPDAKASGRRLSPNMQLTVSLLLFIHLFFVFLALSANLAPRSELHGRLLTKFAFYTQLLHIDLDFVPYHLTHAEEQDVDHRIELLPAGEDRSDDEKWVILPDATWRGSERYKRYQRLGRAMAQLAGQEGAAGRIASSVAAHFLKQRGMTPRQIRCRRHMLQRWEDIRGGTPDQRDPYSEVYFREPYLADCIVLEDSGEVLVSKVASESEVAQPGEPRIEP